MSLHTNRSALLTKQRKVVKERRRQITGKSAADNTGQIVPPENENTYPESADPMDAGFGDDLGLAIEQVQEESAITLVKRRSRFADMISAAEELKDIYKRNSKLE